MNLSRLVLLFSFLPPRDNNAIPVDLRRVESARSIRIRLWKRDWTGIIFTCVYRSARTYSTRATERTVRARASKSNASANDTGASRSFLRSYVDLAAASVSLPFDRPSLSLSLSLPPFFSYPSILLARAQSYLSSVSVPISDFYLSLSIPLYRSPPPSLLLSFSAPRYFARFKRVTLFFSLSSSMIFFHTYSHSFLLFLSFIPFLSLSLIFTLHPIVPAFLVSLLSTVHLSRSLSLSLFLLLSRFTSYAISPSRIFIIVHPVSVRTILPTPTTRVFSLPTSLIPHFIGVYLCSLCVSCRPPTVLHLSLSRTLFLSPSLSIAPFHRCTLRLPFLSPFLTLSLSFSPSCFEHRRSTFFLAVCPPSPSRVHPIWDSPKRARGGSAHHRLIHDYYHLICPAALFIVRAGEIAGQRRILSLETFWPGDLEQIGSRISADSGSGRRAR